MSRKTSGQMIAELEDDLEVMKEADRVVKLWELVYTHANEDQKRKLMTDGLKNLAGFSDEEIAKILTP